MADQHAVRPAQSGDLRRLAGVEQDADRSYRELFGDRPRGPAPTGADRAAAPGFLLVAGEPPVGFAHVLEVDGEAHLEQLAVRTEHQGRGLGTALLEAAVAEARARGHRRLTLSTYRDVPWNAPFYARRGFAELTDPAPFHEQVRLAEARAGLEHDGARVLMVTLLRT